jgi:hypothetical protein
MVLFVGFLPQNTMAVTNVHILLVLHTEHTFMILVTPFYFLVPMLNFINIVLSARIALSRIIGSHNGGY